MPVTRELTEEESQLVAQWTRSSWGPTADPYRDLDLDELVMAYAPDAISIPANHPAMTGQEEIRAWYARRIGDYEMNVESDVDSIDIVGDVAVLVGTFRVTRKPEQGIAALDHAGRWLSVVRKINGVWRMWRDMDTPSPDGDRYYEKLSRGL